MRPEWRRLAIGSAPGEGEVIKWVRLYWLDDQYGWGQCMGQGRVRLMRPDLGTEGWAVDIPGDWAMFDDLRSEPNLDPSLPIDLDRELIPTEREGDHIFWRSLDKCAGEP